jgi:hypothetical protein
MDRHDQGWRRSQWLLGNCKTWSEVNNIPSWLQNVLMPLPFRVAHIYEQVPWLAYYVGYIPSAGEDNKVMRTMCIAQTERRIAAGTTSKDLFYFLVSPQLLWSPRLLIFLGTEQRRRS